MSSEDRKVHRGIPVTTGARTIIDLASCLEGEELAIMVEEAWRKKIAAPSWVKERLKKLAGPGRRTGALSEVLADCDHRETALESALEVRVWRLLRKAKLPVPRNSYPFSDDYGQPCRIDLAYPEQHLAIEADSYEYHGTREAFEVDRLRTSRLAAQGWRLIQVTSKQLDEHPAEVVQRVREALRYRTS